MLSRRRLRRLRYMHARKDRYDGQHDSEEESFMNLLPEMLDQLEQERRQSKVFRVDENSLVRSPNDGDESDSADGGTSQGTLIGLLRTPTEVHVRMWQCN